MNIGKSIRELRILRGIKQYELAKRSGMKQSRISLIESGGNNLTLRTLQRLAKSLRVHLEVTMH